LTCTAWQVVCDIFHLLVLRFRSTLKAEVGIFFPLVALRPLEGSGADAKRKVHLNPLFKSAGIAT
jgi:guanine nucleotide-exchange factor